MKLVVAGDFQYHNFHEFATVTKDGLNSRLAEMLGVMEEIHSFCRSQNVQWFWINGDLFEDRIRLEIDVLHEVYQSIHRIHRDGISVILMEGNHDQFLRYGGRTSLTPFGSFARVVSRPEVIDLAPMISIYAVPFHPDELSLKATLKDFGIKAKRNSSSLFKVLFGHFPVKGAFFNTGEQVSTSGVELNDLCAENYKWVFLSDFHTHQKLARNVTYIGSPLQLNFGDSGVEKGFYFLDFNKATAEFIPTHAPCFHKLKVLNEEQVDSLSAVPSRDYISIETTETIAEVLRQVGNKNWRIVVMPETTEVKQRLAVDSESSFDSVLKAYLDKYKPSHLDSARLDKTWRGFADELQFVPPSLTTRNPMLIKSLTLENFMSWKKDTIPLDRAGLSLIEGVVTGSSEFTSNGAGKCIPAFCRVYDGNTGEVLTIEKFVAEKRKSILGFEDGKVVPISVGEWHCLGKKPTMTLKLENGVEWTAAETHPVFTARGWIPMNQLTKDDWVGEASKIQLRGLDSCSWWEALLLGLVLGDGSIINCLRFSAKDNDVIALFGQCVENVFPSCCSVGYGNKKKGWQVISSAKGSREKWTKQLVDKLIAAGVPIENYVANIHRFLRGSTGLDSETFDAIELDFGIDLWEERCALCGGGAAIKWLQEMEIYGLNSDTKHIPLKFLSLPEESVAALLTGLWQTDGYVASADKQGFEVSYTSVSKQLAQDVRFLLLRLGIKSSIRRKKRFTKWVYTVRVFSTSVQLMAEKLNLVGRKGQRLKELAHRFLTIKKNPNFDVLPPALYQGLPDEGKISSWKSKGCGMSRKKYLELGGNEDIANAEVLWSRVVSIVTGEQQDCYDVTLDSKDHAYIADTLITHNSGILEGILFGLFGRTARWGDDNDKVVNTQVGVNTRVAVELQLGSRKILVERFRAHSKEKNNLHVYIDGVVSDRANNTATQKFLEQLIGWNFIAFRYTYMFGQDVSVSFAAADREQRRLMMERYLGLEELRRMGEHLKEQARQKETKLGMLNAELQTSKQRLEFEKTNLIGCQRRESAWELERTTQLQQLQQKIAAATKKLEMDEAALKKLDEDISVLDKNIADSETSVKQQREEYHALKNEYERTAGNLRGKISLLDDTKLQLEERIRSASAAKVSVCPVCKRPMEATQNKETVNHFKAELAAVETQKNELLIQLQEAQKIKTSLDTLAGVISSHDSTMAPLLEKRNKAVTSRGLVFYSVGQCRSLIAFTTNSFNELQGAVNPYTELVEKSKVNLSDLEKTVAERLVKVTELSNDIEYVEFWARAFGEVQKGNQVPLKSLLFERLIPVLNARAARYAAILTGGTVQVTFVAESSLKTSGKSVDDFHVDVVHNSRSPDYQGNSRGERARIDLCVLLSLAADSEQIFFDEIFDGFDATGIAHVVELLDEESRKRKNIFVITHRQDLQAFFNNRITVVNENDFSHLA